MFLILLFKAGVRAKQKKLILEFYQKKSILYRKFFVIIVLLLNVFWEGMLKDIN